MIKWVGESGAIGPRSSCLRLPNNFQAQLFDSRHAQELSAVFGGSRGEGDDNASGDQLPSPLTSTGEIAPQAHPWIRQFARDLRLLRHLEAGRDLLHKLRKITSSAPTEAVDVDGSTSRSASRRPRNL